MQKLGQHFLNNKPAIAKIIAALELNGDETIIEIGPGRGALTLPLAGKCRELNCKIIAIEKDRRLVDQLRSARVEQFDNLGVTASPTVEKSLTEIIPGDALKLINLLTPKLTNWKLVGNIPYYITGKLLRVLSELESRPSKIVLTIQREVAERIVAEPPKMNLLAAITQFWAQPEIISYLKPSDFSPPPEVESAIIKLVISHRSLVIKSKDYYAFVKIIFKQPRKTILNNLKSAVPGKTEPIKELLKKHGLTGHERPQNLTMEQLKNLSFDWHSLANT